jgi:serine/threonine protein kinase/tetratricopeptide (TPR) repeat protein
MASSLRTAGLSVRVVDDPACLDPELPIMPRTADPARDLLFGLLALQIGLIDQGALFAAFAAWTRDKDRPLADHLIGRGDLDAEQRGLLEALVAQHLKKHGGDPEMSLAAIPAGCSTREGLARLDDPDLEMTLARVATTSTEQDDPAVSDRTATHSVGTATDYGQRFRVLRPHARGGLGAVFVALDTELHREVALKQILDKHADDPASRQRFLLEAEVTGGLEHPGIVPVYGLGTYADGRPFYAMRFIRGDSLKEAIEHFHADDSLKNDPGRRSLELRKLLRRFMDVCNAIDYAHSRGVLHRDLKPGNVMVGRHGETLVVDWGLAKAIGQADPASDERMLRPRSASGSAETLPGSALGTPAYMSPEQATGDLEHLGPRSDVYSLGAMLYSLLTARPPFAGEAADVIPAVQRGEFLPPRRLDPAIDAALEAVCLKAMALKPVDRYGSCRALAEDIERWMADEPVSAWSEPLRRRARRWARRHRSLVTGAAATLLAGVVSLGGVAAVQARSNLRLREANEATGRALDEARSAKRATDKALSQSEEARRQAVAVSRFLVEAFRKPDPSRDGRELKVIELLDGATEKLDSEYAGAPGIKGELLGALGETYQGLGLYDKAAAAHERALEVRRTTVGPDHPDALTTSNQLAHAYLAAGRPSAAIGLLEKARAPMELKLGPDHAETLNGMGLLGMAYLAEGSPSRAVPILEDVLAKARVKLGPDHPQTLEDVRALATAYQEAGQLARAVPLFEAAFARRRATLGPEHPGTLNSMNDLALAYHYDHQASRSMPLYEEALGKMRAKYGPDHPDTLTTMNNLALAYVAAGRATGAIPVLEEALARMTTRLGRDHPKTLTVMICLGYARNAAGDPSRAIPVLEEALRLRKAKEGPDHPDTLGDMKDLAMVLTGAGRMGEGEALLRDALSGWRRTLPPGSPRLAGALDALGDNLLRQGKAGEAEPLLRECLAIRESKTPDDWMTFKTRSLLGASLLQRGRYAEAEPLVTSGYEGLKAREARIPATGRSDLSEAAGRVVRLYEAWSRPEQARSWSEKLGLADLPSDVFARP